jgi:hypothetical protein
MKRSDIEEAFERGRQVGRQEGLAFEGVPRLGPLPGAEFRFVDSWFESYVEYERRVVDNLRRVQHLRWLKHREPLDLEAIEGDVLRELRRVQRAVDVEREEGRGRACVVAAMRALPQLPGSVREYGSMAEFVAEDERRAVFDWPAREDLGGADFGLWWSLENPFKRWLTTGWRISWLCEEGKFMGADDLVHDDDGEATTELYALEFPNRDGGRRHGRVWLLGKLRTRAAVDRALFDLQVHAIRERNSLIAAADAVALVGREEERRA